MRTLLIVLVVTLGVRGDESPTLTAEEQQLAAEAERHNAAAFGDFQAGRFADAVVKLRQALKIREQVYSPTRFPGGHDDLATSHNNLALVLLSMGQGEQALQGFEQALAAYRRLYPPAKHPDGHFNIATALNNMGLVLDEIGQTERAHDHFRQGLVMRQKLAGADDRKANGSLAGSHNNVAATLERLGKADQAMEHYREALALWRKVYPIEQFPDGDPEISGTLGNLGVAAEALGKLPEALDYHQQALAMDRKLYPPAKFPQGHPRLAICLNNVGSMLAQSGKAAEGLPYVQSALEMRRRLFPPVAYPDGHLRLAGSLYHLAVLSAAAGQPEKALEPGRQSVVMQQNLLRREVLTASEEAAFDKVAAAPPFRDSYLTLTRTRADAADDYAAIWPSRSMVNRLLEIRRAGARAAGDKLDKLKANRERIERLVQTSRGPSGQRDKALAALADERDRLERNLVAGNPSLRRWQELDQLGPADLARALPKEAAFVDLVYYIRGEPAGRRRSPCYAAFVVSAERPIRRVELGEAAPIDAAIRRWRDAIETRAASPDAAELVRRVWQPLAEVLPPNVQTLYLAADGDLARLPWAALPVADDRVLLETLAIATVPHGLFLLDHLKSPRKDVDPETSLGMGGLNYGRGVWPALPGTADESRAIATLAPGVHIALTGDAATPARLMEAIQKARFAHLATHGEFKAEELAAERRRAASPQSGDRAPRIAAKNPLAYVGLVLSGGETLSGLAIQDLPANNLKLVTLSACETGLGEFTGGKGVENLQMAFHLAGAQNVVASLWKVNDAATAALMAKFYHELWVNKREPLAALREAQLTIYHHPELIADLSGERGAPKAKEALAVNTTGTSPVAREKRADTKLWAAFVLSGAGQ